MKGLRLSAVATGFLVATAACGTAGGSEAIAHGANSSVADPAHPWRKPSDVIDSLKPMAELIGHFREGTTAPGRLEGGARNPEGLVRRLLAAISSRDSAKLYRLVVSRAEFAWLIFPQHPYARPPYELDPEIFWLQLQAQNANGLTRALQRYGGQPLTLLSLGCREDGFQTTAGTRVRSNCEVRYRAGSTVVTDRLFGSIVEHEGWMKFLSYADGR